MDQDLMQYTVRTYNVLMKNQVPEGFKLEATVDKLVDTHLVRTTLYHRDCMVAWHVFSPRQFEVVPMDYLVCAGWDMLHNYRTYMEEFNPRQLRLPL